MLAGINPRGPQINSRGPGDQFDRKPNNGLRCPGARTNDTPTHAMNHDLRCRQYFNCSPRALLNNAARARASRCEDSPKRDQRASVIGRVERKRERRRRRRTRRTRTIARKTRTRRRAAQRPVDRPCRGCKEDPIAFRIPWIQECRPQRSRQAVPGNMAFAILDASRIPTSPSGNSHQAGYPDLGCVAACITAVTPICPHLFSFLLSVLLVLSASLL